MGLFTKRNRKKKTKGDFKPDDKLLESMAINVEDASVFEFKTEELKTKELKVERVEQVEDVLPVQEKCYMPEEMIIEEPEMEESLEKMFLKKEIEKIEKKEERKIEEVVQLEKKRDLETSEPPKKELYLQSGKKYMFDFQNCEDCNTITFYDSDDKIITFLKINYNKYQMTSEVIFFENRNPGISRVQSFRLTGNRMKILFDFNSDKLFLHMNNKIKSCLKRINTKCPVKATWTHETMSIV